MRLRIVGSCNASSLGSHVPAGILGVAAGEIACFLWSILPLGVLFQHFSHASKDARLPIRLMH